MNSLNNVKLCYTIYFNFKCWVILETIFKTTGHDRIRKNHSPQCKFQRGTFQKRTFKMHRVDEAR